MSLSRSKRTPEKLRRPPSLTKPSRPGSGEGSRGFDPDILRELERAEQIRNGTSPQRPSKGNGRLTDLDRDYQRVLSDLGAYVSTCTLLLRGDLTSADAAFEEHVRSKAIGKVEGALANWVEAAGVSPERDEGGLSLMLHSLCAILNDHCDDASA